MASIRDHVTMELTGDPHVAQEMLGHSTALMTLRHYDQISARRKDDVLRRVSEVYERGLGG